MTLTGRTLITLIAIWFLASHSVSAADAGRKYALVVGVEQYDPSQLTRLQYAEDDALSLGGALQSLGFDVVAMTSQSIPARKPVIADDIRSQLARERGEILALEL